MISNSALLGSVDILINGIASKGVENSQVVIKINRLRLCEVGLKYNILIYCYVWNQVHLYIHFCMHMWIVLIKPYHIYTCTYHIIYNSFLIPV